MDSCPINVPEIAAKEAAAVRRAVYCGLKRQGTSCSMKDAAASFFRLLESEPNGPAVTETRKSQVFRDIERYGFYEQTLDELVWGSRFAWRHSVRCVGRYFWKQLEVVDARECASVEEVAGLCFDHIASATNGGSIRPLVTIFKPEQCAKHFRIWNRQLTRYAGYREADGEIIGDPAEADLTEDCVRSGWIPPKERGRFDLLPLLVSEANAAPRVFQIPQGQVLEVPLKHPEFGWFAELGLRWYAAPIISNMVLEIGGIRYPAAPFNGWYMGTEIGARNLADLGRYNVLVDVAERMGIWSRRESGLWRDRALVEVNRAVLFSYQERGVRIIDHHTAAQLHVKFEEEEQALGRPVTGRWDWLVPPMSGATTPVWGRQYEPTEYSPNFFEQESPVQRQGRIEA